LCKWIQDFVSRGSMGIKVNYEIGHFFKLWRNWDKGPPFLLFCLV
jgi:hypothetical protein